MAVLEARKLKKMDITGASDPYVKLKLFDAKQKRIGKKKKTSVKSCNLNPYWNESFVFIIDEMDMKRVTLDITVSIVKISPDIAIRQNETFFTHRRLQWYLLKMVFSFA